MADEGRAGDSPLGGSATQAPWEVHGQGRGPLSSSRRTHGTGHPVADHYEGCLVGPGGRPSVSADLNGSPELGDLFPGGPRCVYQGLCVPDPPAGGLVQPCLERGSRTQVPGQERRGEYSSPLTGPQAGGACDRQQWSRVTGIVGSQVEIRGGVVYVSPHPGPVNVDHVALAGRVGGG